jgi:hypothetical protein
MEAMKRNEAAEITYQEENKNKLKAEKQNIFALFQGSGPCESCEEMLGLLDQCEGAAMPEFLDGIPSHIDMVDCDSDSSDCDFEQEPMGSDDCDSTDSDDVVEIDVGLHHLRPRARARPSG